MSKLEFDLSAKGLSLANAALLVKMADCVYGDLGQLENKLKNDFSIVKYVSFDIEDTQAFLAADDAVIFLAFRGTTSGRDWCTDCKVKLISSVQGRVHFGFNEALDFIWDGLEKSIRDFQDNNQTIFITGHSLGGALAVLAADRLIEKSIEVKGIYTFGQPRVGDKDYMIKFDKKMKERTFRFVHDEDVVPRLPSIFQGYCHIGTEIYFNREGKMYLENIRWQKLVSRSISVAIRSSNRASELRSQNRGGICDHGLGYYEKCIRKNLIRQKGGPTTFQEYINS